MRPIDAVAWATSPLGWRMLALSGAVASLAAVALTPIAPDPQDDVPRAGSGTRAAIAAGRTDEGAYPAISQHPLFLAGRRPWEPPPAPSVPQVVAPLPPPAAARAPPRNYALVGVVISDGLHVAFLRAGARTMSLLEGSQLEGWTLREVRADGLRFEADGATFELAFPTPKPASPARRPL